MTQILVSLVWAFSFSSLEAQAAKIPLFTKGAETFLLQDKSGKTPQFQVLDDSATEQALAAIVVTTLNADPKVLPKIPVGQPLKLRIESLELGPSTDGPNKLVVSLNLSGHDVELNRPVDKAKFLAGETVTVDFPESTKNLAFFNLESSGRLKLRLDKATDNIIVEEARAKTYFTSMTGADGTENISFTGKGLRQPK